MTDAFTQPARPNPRSLAILVLAWLTLQIGGLFTPGLLDDVDSVYLEIAREMLHRHDFVTPYIDGIRFFDKPPLMYWLAAGSMHVFGESDWAGRLPLALAVLALLFAVYVLGLRLFRSERAGFYSALAVATAVGPYLYTRFYIPDILICLWMTLGVHAFLVALERTQQQSVILSAARSARSKNPEATGINATARTTQPQLSSLVACLIFAATLALNLLTKGLIGLVFPIAFVFLYLAITRQLHLLPRFHLIPSTLVFAAIALPWHILAAIRNPAIAMPAGLGLPARAGWAWFYLYNEHVARFLGKRIPHDYGNTPVWLFWLYALIWIMPWAIFLPAAVAKIRLPNPREAGAGWSATNSERLAALTTTLWALIVLLFFSVSNRQEYYSLPAIPALALMIGGFLATCDKPSGTPFIEPFSPAMSGSSARAAQLCHRFLLLPLASLIAITCAFFAITAPVPLPGTDLSYLLSSNPALYNVSLGHIFDLTGAAMGFFRGPLIAVTVGMLILGAVSYGFRRRGRTYAANLILAAGMTLVLLAAHEGLVRFNPILGSKDLALAILDAQHEHPEPNDLILLDGELTSGSTLLFYTRQPVHLVNGRINGPWFGSFWPDAPPIFETEASLRQLWQGPRRIFLLTYVPASRTTDLAPFGPVHVVASAGGKTVLTNR
jgi:4-amino-4-deoxy-L-arabinose transferase-like glycosyltransferase